MRRWFRMKLRKIFKRPKDLTRASITRRRLAFWYLFGAWNALGLCIYSWMKTDYPMTPSEEKIPALWYLRMIGETKADVVSFEGFTKKSHVHFDAESDTMTPVISDSILPVYPTDEAEEEA